MAALTEQLKLAPSLLSCFLCCPCSQASSDVPHQHVVHCRQLGQIANFTGNEKDYYDPDNSCMNMVLQRQTGIPITLGLLYMVVAHRLGLSLHGLNLPGHLMVGNSIEGVTNLLVDPFDGNACGALPWKVSHKQCRNWALHVQGAARYQAVPCPTTGTVTACDYETRLSKTHYDHLHHRLYHVQRT